MKADNVFCFQAWFCYNVCCLIKPIFNEVLNALLEFCYPPWKAEKLEYISCLVKVFSSLLFLLCHVWGASGVHCLWACDECTHISPWFLCESEMTKGSKHTSKKHPFGVPVGPPFSWADIFAHDIPQIAHARPCWTFYIQELASAERTLADKLEDWAYS